MAQTDARSEFVLTLRVALRVCNFSTGSPENTKRRGIAAHESCNFPSVHGGIGDRIFLSDPVIAVEVLPEPLLQAPQRFMERSADLLQFGLELRHPRLQRSRTPRLLPNL
jgi:hypothetical protein